MKQLNLWMLAAILFSCGISVQAQTKRPDDFRAKYQLKEVVAVITSVLR